MVSGWDEVKVLDCGGGEPLEVSTNEFSEALKSENRTLKRALTDPRMFSGIGNACSDEILWQAQMSPVKRTGQLSDGEVVVLHRAVVDSLNTWIDRL